MKAGIYVRVSTDDQDPENQMEQLKALCVARGWTISQVYRDNASGRDPARLVFNDLMHDARTGFFGVLVFWSWDRITRGGVKPAFEIMEKWKSWNLRWESLQEPFLSSAADPHTSELLLAILAWSAKQEAIRISERTKAGLARRKALGHALGRRLRFPWTDEEIHAVHLGGYADGSLGVVRDTARVLGVSRDKVYRVLRHLPWLKGSPTDLRRETA